MSAVSTISATRILSFELPLSAGANGTAVTVARKAGMDGRLFGSVGNADIAEALKVAGFDVDKAAVRMPEGPLKAIGEFPLDIALHTDVLANITVNVVAE